MYIYVAYVFGNYDIILAQTTYFTQDTSNIKAACCEVKERIRFEIQ